MVGLGNVNNTADSVKSVASATNATNATNIVSGGTIASNVTATTQTAGTNNTTIATTAFVIANANAGANAIPSGGIIMWSGSIILIPAGWYLCNGFNGTPDLRDRFIVGAGTNYNIGATGGSTDAVVVSHTHIATSTVTDLGHFHSVSGAGNGKADGGNGGAWYNGSTNTSTNVTGITVATTNALTGSSGTNANLPPYYALAYIMKS
jgi:hypothetical protein